MNVRVWPDFSFFQEDFKMKRLALFSAVVFCIGILLSLSGTPTQAQTASSGSITGQVSDPQGASVPGADVTLTDIGTKSKQSATTNDSGRYTFPVVNSGLYDIVVSKSGFKVAKMAQQKVSIGLVLTVNVTLEVGSLAETVVVTSSPLGSELQTANATIGNTIDLKQLELLPNLGRDATSLLSLQPGVTPRGDIAGSYMDQNTFTVDGGNNTDDMAGNTIGYIQNFTGLAGAQTSAMSSGVVATPIETVEEFKVNILGVLEKLRALGLECDDIICDLPVGPCHLINDSKAGGVRAIAHPLLQDAGLKNVDIP